MTEAGPCGGSTLAWAVRTDVGHVRALNEDSHLAAPPVFAVADGMGGHEAGEIASALAVERLRGLAEEGAPSIEAVAEELRTTNALLRHASAGSSAPMGTTAVGLALIDNGGTPGWLLFNVGDSRAYLAADGELALLTRDHSYVQDLVDVGEITAQEARHHPDRNIVTRALGAGNGLDADLWVRAVRAGERFLLCSDGLTGEVPDAAIAEVLLGPSDPAEAAALLVDLALDAGGRDNVTALVVDVVAVAAGPDGGADGPPRTDTGPGAADGVGVTTERRPAHLIAHVPGAPAAPADRTPRATGRIDAVPADLAPTQGVDDVARPGPAPLIEALRPTAARPADPGGDRHPEPDPPAAQREDGP